MLGPQKVAKRKEHPLISGKSRLVKIWPDVCCWPFYTLMKFWGLDDRCSIYLAVWGWNTGGYIDNWNSCVWLQSASLHLTASHWNRWCILLPMHCDQGRPFPSELRRRQISSKTLWLMGGESYPRCSMYGIFTYIYHRRKPNVGTVNIPYTEHMGTYH